MILNIDKSLIWSKKMQINESNLQSSGIFRSCKENLEHKKGVKSDKKGNKIIRISQFKSVKSDRKGRTYL